MSDCRKCGGKKASTQQQAGWDYYSDPRPDQRGIYALNGDGAECEPYHGAYRGATVWVVGLGVEGKERLFLYGDRGEAERYAINDKLLLARRSVVQFCHDRIYDLIGA